MKGQVLYHLCLNESFSYNLQKERKKNLVRSIISFSELQCIFFSWVWRKIIDQLAKNMPAMLGQQTSSLYTHWLLLLFTFSSLTHAQWMSNPEVILISTTMFIPDVIVDVPSGTVPYYLSTSKTSPYTQQLHRV